MNPHIALKEIQPVVQSIACRQKTILVRKGGILDKSFELKRQPFLLFPTVFHVDSEVGMGEERPVAPVAKSMSDLTIEYVGELTAAWQTSDRHAPDAVKEFHPYEKKILEKRLRWKERDGVPLTISEIRVSKLHTPLVIPNSEAFWGCFSWVDNINLDKSVDDLMSRSTPVLNDHMFKQKQNMLRCLIREHIPDAKELKW